MPDLPVSPQRETEGIAPWMWGILVLLSFVLAYFGDVFGTDLWSVRA
jgi:hypothetical protein